MAAVACLLAGCGRKQTELGEGGSIVAGSAGPAGAHNASHELLKCDAPVATMALVENPNGYILTGTHNLPNSPLPLVRLIAQQSGCFRVVDRAAGLKATVQEQELQEAGIIRKATTVHKGKGYEAQYGPFDYDAFVVREQAGLVPDGSGPQRSKSARGGAAVTVTSAPRRTAGE